jgi:4-amino-4-deoxy-L-arabinose transferase-like glycosyltransferase
MERRGLASRLRWAALPATARILLPVCGLLLLGVPYLFRGFQGLDDRLFISAAHGVLTHGYPFETVHYAHGQPFDDHTPLFPYMLVGPALVDGAIGLQAAVMLGRLITAAFGLGTVVVTYLVCRDVRGPVSGVVAAVLVASSPYFVRLSWVMHMEVPMAFFLVLALYCLVHERMLYAGLAIATAVMLKEHAVGFWLVAGAWVLVARGWRQAIRVALPSVVAFAAWAAIAYAIDPHQFGAVMNRWLNSAGGSGVGPDIRNPRFGVTLPHWALVVARDVIGLPLGGITLVTMAVAVVRRARVPGIVVVPLAYAALAVAASFLVHLKEPRWLIAVVPMLAIAVGLLVDWGALARWVTRYGRVAGDKPGVSAA